MEPFPILIIFLAILGFGFLVALALATIVVILWALFGPPDRSPRGSREK